MQVQERVPVSISGVGVQHVLSLLGTRTGKTLVLVKSWFDGRGELGRKEEQEGVGGERVEEEKEGRQRRNCRQKIKKTEE